jgi:hypothetical protein
MLQRKVEEGLVFLFLRNWMKWIMGYIYFKMITCPSIFVNMAKKIEFPDALSASILNF